MDGVGSEPNRAESRRVNDLTAERFLADYKIRVDHEVPFGEVDMLQHVNNVAYAEWAERIRSIFFADVIGEDIRSERGMIIARHDLHYLAPVAYREKLAIGGRITRWGTKSFEFETVVWSYASERAVFRAVATLVAYDYRRTCSIAVPGEWRERVAAFQGPLAS